MTYEYCVMRDGDDKEPHRNAPKYLSDDASWDPWAAPEDDRATTEDEQRKWCENWVQEWDEMSENKGARKDMFYVAKRPVGPWERM